MYKTKKIAVLFPLSLFLIAAGCKHSPPAETSTEPAAADAAPAVVEMENVRVGPMDTVVTAIGTLVPKQGGSSRIASSVPGRLVKVIAKEGDAVRAGQVLAEIDSRTSNAQTSSAIAALKAANAQAVQSQLNANAAASDQSSAVRTAELALRAAKEDRNTTVRQAQIALQTAINDQAKLKAGARTQEIAQAEQAVRQATATKTRAQTEKDRVQYLFSKGIYSKRQLEDATTSLEIASSNEISARQALELLKAGARSEDIQAAQLRVDQAREALSQAKQMGESRVAQANAALKQARSGQLSVAAKRQEAQAMRESARQKIADLQTAQAAGGLTQIRSPINGIVTRRTLNSGDIADPSTPIFEVSNSQSLDLVANLNAAEGVLVRPNLLALIKVSEFPGVYFQARVISVGQIDPQSNLMGVRLSVPNPQNKLKGGEFATAEISVRKNPHAMSISQTSLINRNGKPTVMVVNLDGTAHEKTVTVGSERAGRIEITSGLTPKDKIIKSGQYSLADGAKVVDAAEAAKKEPAADKKGSSE